MPATERASVNKPRRKEEEPPSGKPAACRRGQARKNVDTGRLS